MCALRAAPSDLEFDGLRVCPEQQNGGCDDLSWQIRRVTGSTSGIGLGCSRPGPRGRQRHDQRLRRARPRSRRCAARSSAIHVKALYSPGRHGEARRDRRDGAPGRRGFRVGGRARQQCRHPIVAPVEELPPEKWDTIIAINLSAAFHAMRAAVPGMKARGWGRIINTARRIRWWPRRSSRPMWRPSTASPA